MKKTNHHNKIPTPTMTKLCFKEQYENIYSWASKKKPDIFFEETAAKLIGWAKKKKDNPKDSEVVFHDFLDENNISWRTWYIWLEESPLLKASYTHAKSCIGGNRERGALKKDLDASTVIKSMPIYSEEWRQLKEWEAKLLEGQLQGVPKATMPEIPSSEGTK